MRWGHRSFLILLLVLVGIPLPMKGQEGSAIPLDTLGKKDSLEKWAFWNRDPSPERFPDSVPPPQLVKLPIDTGDLKGMDPKGIGWIGVRIYVPDSLLGERWRIDVHQYGACTIYIDGERLGSIGKVGKKEEEQRRFRRLFDSYQHVFHEAGPHFFLLRFSDQRYEEERKDHPGRPYGPFSPGFNRMEPGDSFVWVVELVATLGSFGGFLLALGLIHLLIFLFYPKKRGNLYYVLFVGILAFLIFYSTRGISEDPIHRLHQMEVLIYSFHLFSYSLLTLVYAFLRRKGFGVIFWSLIGVGIFLLLACYFDLASFELGLTLLYLPLVYIEALRIIITAIRRKDKGSWILGAGAGFFIAFPLSLLLLASIIQDLHINLNGYSGVILITTWTISVPLSMSIYLAYDFATTNRDLERKLAEVEELNEQNLKQEREKQRILEEKKEELEEKVEERTAELKDRKEEIEAAHREITDSINYAQRIQEAVLPEDERYEALPEHFILFRPRDPVSGDFHWGKKEGDRFYLAAVDCTGHGVPGGFMSMLGVSFLNEIMASDPDLMPGEVLTRLKERVVKELASGQGVQSKDGMDMALLKFTEDNSNSDSKTVEFAGAQNPLYILRKGIAEDPPAFEVFRNGERIDEEPWKPFRDNADGIEVQGDKAGIGSEEHGVDHFRTVSFKATKGDTLYIFSDGYADQFGGDKGKKFRYGPFKRLLSEVRSLSMEEQKEELERRFEEWKGDREQVDDVLVIGVRL